MHNMESNEPLEVETDHSRGGIEGNNGGLILKKVELKPLWMIGILGGTQMSVIWIGLLKGPR